MEAQPVNNAEVKKMLHGIAAWEAPAVASFLQEVKRILEKKTKNRLSKKETALFLIINKAVLTPDDWTVYTTLHSKFESETISDKEQVILDKLVGRLEQHGIKRLEALVELAQLRNTSLDQLMLDLGIKNITPDAHQKANA